MISLLFSRSWFIDLFTDELTLRDGVADLIALRLVSASEHANIRDHFSADALLQASRLWKKYKEESGQGDDLPTLLVQSMQELRQKPAPPLSRAKLAQYLLKANKGTSLSFD